MSPRATFRIIYIIFRYNRLMKAREPKNSTGIETCFPGIIFYVNAFYVIFKCKIRCNIPNESIFLPK